MEQRRPAHRLTLDKSTYTITIDGQEFPFFLHEDGPTVETYHLAGGIHVVNLPVLVEEIEVIPEKWEAP